MTEQAFIHWMRVAAQHVPLLSMLNEQVRDRLVMEIFYVFKDKGAFDA